MATKQYLLSSLYFTYVEHTHLRVHLSPAHVMDGVRRTAAAATATSMCSRDTLTLSPFILFSCSILGIHTSALNAHTHSHSHARMKKQNSFRFHTHSLALLTTRLG